MKRLKKIMVIIPITLVFVIIVAWIADPDDNQIEIVI